MKLTPNLNAGVLPIHSRLRSLRSVLLTQGERCCNDRSSQLLTRVYRIGPSTIGLFISAAGPISRGTARNRSPTTLDSKCIEPACRNWLAWERQYRLLIFSCLDDVINVGLQLLHTRSDENLLLPFRLDPIPAKRLKMTFGGACEQAPFILWLLANAWVCV
jgi:hypothetical protein